MSNGKNLDYFSPEKENVSPEIGSHVENAQNHFLPEVKDTKRVEAEQVASQFHITRNEKASKEKF